MRRRGILIGLAILISTASPAAAQSLFSTRGLGLPVAPLSARARALGGIGLGLPGLDGSLVNPAAIIGLPGRGGIVGLQPFSQTIRFEGRENGLGATRFPLLRIVLPFSDRVSGGIGYGAFVDRTWRVISEGEARIGGDTLRTRDLITSSGGIGQARVTLGFAATPSLSIGVAAGMYTGGADRELQRTFPDSAAAGIEEFTINNSVTFHGPLAVLGLRWDPVPAARIGASVSWSGELSADSADGASTRKIDLPWRASVGASALLTPRLSVNVGGRWTGWESAEPAIGQGDAVSDTWQAGGGFEWEGAQIGDNALPLRLGFHYEKLPFKLNGAVPAEWSAALGAGFRVRSEGEAIGVFDAALERGERGSTGSTGLAESFWRATFSLGIFGF